MAAILGAREVIPRSYEHRLGDSPTATRVFVVTVDEPVSSGLVLAYLGISHGSPHPEHMLTCDSISVEETDRHHVQATYTYGIQAPDEPGGDGGQTPPWISADRWTFSTSNASVACTRHFPFNAAAGNENVSKPLTNTAGDEIFGISKAEAELRITISGSRLTLNLKDFKKYVNTINSTPWAGFPKHTVQCVGVSGTPERADVNGVVTDYWNISIELIYRSTTHNLLLPNVGWHVIVDGRKQRAWTYIEENNEYVKVATPHPVALNNAGGFLCGPQQVGEPYWDGGTTGSDDGSSYLG